MIRKFFSELGISNNQNIIVHSSLKKVISAFPRETPSKVIKTIQNLIGDKGSLIMPAFTYCLKSIDGSHEIFDRMNTAGKVGALAEVFRTSENVIRTSSPTHSFSLWGKITSEINYDNSPTSPLGAGSVLDWLANNDNSLVLMLGTHFDSLSFCHYLEIKAKVPWYDYFPWHYLGKEKIGISITGEQSLIEVPGCSRAFINFETYLNEKQIIIPILKHGLMCYFIPIYSLLDNGLLFFKNYPENLLCSQGSCRACDFRRDEFLN